PGLCLECLDDRCLPSFVSAGGIVGTRAVVAADFNNDKNLDTASVNKGDMGASTLSVQLGNKNGQFGRTPSNTWLAYGATPLAVGPFNNDKNLDLIATNTDSQGNGSVVVFLGKGDGTFTRGNTARVGVGPQALAVADFNNDGQSDVAVVGWAETDVLLGNGKG